MLITDNRQGVSPFIGEVLGFGSDHRTVIDLVAATQACPAHEAGVGHDLAIITNHDILINIGEGMDNDTRPDLRLFIYVC